MAKRGGRGAAKATVWAAALMAAASAPSLAPAQEGCEAPQQKCGGMISRECLSSLGAGVMALGEAKDCQAQMTAYRGCLADIAASCPGPKLQQETTADSDRLQELARLGGLIEAPETAVEFYNNALVYARRGDLLNGRKMLEKSIAAGATQIDVHQRYVQLLKAQEGLIGAREVMADLVRRAPDNKGAALAAATLQPAPKRRAALEALLEGEDAFAPAHYELAALSSADRVGDQSLGDQRAEKAALEAFKEADEAGRIYRWFLDKTTVEVWRESARRRLALYANRNLDIAPVTLTATASNDSWNVVFQIVETAREIRYRVDGGPIKSTGATTVINPQTGAPTPRSFIALPLGTERAEIEIWYDNVRGEEEGPFTLVFDAQQAFVASAKQILGQLTQKWIQDRAWEGGSQLVYFTHLVAYRCGLSKIEYGVETDAPDTAFPLTSCAPKNPYAIGEGQETHLDFEKPVSHITVRLTYADGTTSEIRRFDF